MTRYRIIRQGKKYHILWKDWWWPFWTCCDYMERGVIKPVVCQTLAEARDLVLERMTPPVLVEEFPHPEDNR